MVIASKNLLRYVYFAGIGISTIIGSIFGVHARNNIVNEKLEIIKKHTNIVEDDLFRSYKNQYHVIYDENIGSIKLKSSKSDQIQIISETMFVKCKNDLILKYSYIPIIMTIKGLVVGVTWPVSIPIWCLFVDTPRSDLWRNVKVVRTD
jgi:hypothetical protein